MSKRYTHQMRYECDSCEAMALGWDDELPPGWTESVTLVDVEDGKPVSELTHKCEKCAAK